jgi:hypothetical protein
MTDPINSRIECNKHVARDLRRRLETRYAKGTHTRRILNTLIDAELTEIYLANNQQGREHAPKMLAEKGDEHDVYQR